MINEFLNIFYEIYRNPLTKKTILIFFVLLFLTYFLSISNNEIISKYYLFIIIIYIILAIVYILINFYKILYKITSYEFNKEEIKFWDFFWSFNKFQSKLSYIFFIPLIYIFLLYNLNFIGKLDSFNYDHEKILIKRPEIIIMFQVCLFIFSVSNIIFIGSRSFRDSSSKLRSLFSSKKILIYLFIYFCLTLILIIIYSYDFLKYSNYSINKLIYFIIIILRILTFISIIRKWQKLYFSSNIEK